MKQLLITNTTAPKTSMGTDCLAKGQLFLITSADGLLTIGCGNGTNLVPNSFIVYLKNIKWTKTEYAAGTKFAATIAVSSVAGSETAVVLSKRGAVFNQRNIWTTSGKDITTLTANINKSSETHGLKATANSSNVTLAPIDTNDYSDWDVSVITTTYNAQGLPVETTSDPTSITHGVAPIGDAEYVKNLAHKCIGDRGQGYTDIDAAPNGNINANRDYFVGNISGTYDIYNIKTYVPRFDHNIDEPLYHTIHIAVPHSAASAVGAPLERFLNTGNSASAGS